MFASLNLALIPLFPHACDKMGTIVLPYKYLISTLKTMRCSDGGKSNYAMY